MPPARRTRRYGARRQPTHSWGRIAQTESAVQRMHHYRDEWRSKITAPTRRERINNINNVLEEVTHRFGMLPTYRRQDIEAGKWILRAAFEGMATAVVDLRYDEDCSREQERVRLGKLYDRVYRAIIRLIRTIALKAGEVSGMVAHHYGNDWRRRKPTIMTGLEGMPEAEPGSLLDQFEKAWEEPAEDGEENEAFSADE